MTQRVLEIRSPRYIPPGALDTGRNIDDFFPKEQPLALEIGCGIGDFILQRAQQQPRVNFLAIDIYNKGCLKTCRRIDEAELDNVRVMRIEARQLFSDHLAPQSLTAIYINCPDPWPKKRHRSRRLVSPTFLDLVAPYLQPQGELFFATDFTDYAEQVAEFVPDLKSFTNCCATPIVTDLTNYPVSKYMRRFLDLGQPIYYAHLRRRDNLPLTESAEVPQGFRARWGAAIND
ncbi:MAG: tRNA (guanosine(46)-N7)-methyltransferase TrmB [Desulfuromonas sp.]|nr:MAG: tRNA (guanosine(46)-N7)-methyltransferase TrmB [Desulfuromonas sp.]